MTISMLLSARLRLWGGRLLIVLAGQGVVQAVNVILGVFLVRWLSLETYAQYSVVFAFQCTLSMFVDLGFGGCIVSLVGDRGNRPEVVGSYIAGARWFRTLLFAMVVPASAGVFYWIGVKHGWSIGSQCLLFACIAATLYFEGGVALYSAPLLIHQRLTGLYRTQSFGSIGRMVATGLLYLSGALSAVSLALTNSLTTAWTASRYAKEAKPYVLGQSHSEPAVRQEMLRYLAPMIPGMVFVALQGQLSLFLVSIFGKSHNVAEVAALGRLGQVFVLFSTVNNVIIAPYIAQLAKSLLSRRYLQILVSEVAFAAAVVALAIAFPGPLLWVLGNKYQHLEQAFGWMMLASCLSFIGGTMWAMHSARKWIFWWGTVLYISLLTAVQTAFVAFGDMGSTKGVLQLSVATNLAVLVVHAVTAFIGFSKERSERPADYLPKATPTYHEA